MTRLLIVGRGSIGRRHLEWARKLAPRAEIGVVLGRKPERKPGAADICFASVDEALSFAPQAAVIATPATKHLEDAKRLADVGAHLMVEKPLAADVREAARLTEICATKGVTLLVGYNLRFVPSLRAFRELIKKEKIGKVLSVRAEVGQYLPDWRDRDYRQSVSAQRKLGGGVLLELSHEIDYLRWIFGDIDWVSATVRRQSDLEIDVEDTALLTLGFLPHGTRELAASLALDFVRHDRTRMCTAIGTQGTLRWDALNGTVSILRKSASNWKVLYAKPPKPDESYIAEWRHFFDCISGAPPLIAGSDALAVLEVIAAARKSSDQRKVVKVGRQARRSTK